MFICYGLFMSLDYPLSIFFNFYVFMSFSISLKLTSMTMLAYILFI